MDILSKTARFLKKTNLKSPDNHLKGFSLNMEDEDLEYEWRLEEMSTKRVIAKYTCLTCVLQTLAWSFLLSEVSLLGKLLKLGIIAA